MSKFSISLNSKVVLGLAAATAVVGLTTLSTQSFADTTVPVQVLGINDFHGNIATTNKAKMPNGVTIPGAGTAAELAGYLNYESNTFAKANPNGVSFRVESGDMISASPAQSSLLYDQPTEAVLHAMNIQVGTLGNHEFDKGLADLNDILNGKDPVANDTSAAAQFYKEYTQSQLSGGYQMVVANVVNKSNGQIPNGYQPYTILTKQLNKTQNVYRVYNPNSGEHLYTESSYEQSALAKVGWKAEGVAFVSQLTGNNVYRLYNKATGEHFYTTSAYEQSVLVKSGVWSAEGVAYHSAAANQGTPIYRLYNKNSGRHFYTTSSYEQASLVKAGWTSEGIAWYAAKNQTLKIGVIGVITTDTSDIVTAKQVAPYTFLDPATQIAKYDKALRAQGVNAIMVLGHTASVNANNDPAQPVQGETADVINKLNTIDPNNAVDLYIAGHSHSFTDGVVGHTQVVQALSFGVAFDNVSATYDVDKGTLKVNTADIIPVDPTNKAVTPDATVASIVNNASTITDKIANQPIGSFDPATGTTLSKTNSAVGESPLGDFITKAQLTEANKAGMNAVAAFTNTGGIRADFIGDPATGNLTWGAVETSQPFGDVEEVISMTGQQIVDVLNQQRFGTKDPSSDDYSLQEFGLNYTITDNPDKTAIDFPYVVSSVTIAATGKLLDLNASYNVVVNDFIQGGGDTFTGFKLPVLPGFQDTDLNVLVNYIKDLTAAGQKVPTTMPVEKTYVAAGTPLK